uniref:integrase core domain-containing protein n=1 Tax=Burkholderia stagnalis TaxID=1503054 RepID=UPI001FC8E33D
GTWRRRCPLLPTSSLSDSIALPSSTIYATVLVKCLRQNGADESFNGKFRDECLSLEWFRTRTEAKVVIEQWRRHYNGIRPHSSLAYLTPDEFKQQYCSTEATEAVPQA